MCAPIDSANGEAQCKVDGNNDQGAAVDDDFGDDSDATFTDLVASDAPDPARATTNGEFAALVAACMESLDPRHREILTLRTRLHRPYEEIAATLGLNVGTVKSRIARARESLRSKLGEDFKA